MSKKNRKRKTPGLQEKRPVQKSPDPGSLLIGVDPMCPAHWYRFLAVFVSALGIRLVYFFINKDGNPLFYHPILDPLFHHEQALDILNGNFWGDDVFFKAPLYPYFLALLYKIGSSSAAFAILIQHVMGAVGVVLVYFLSRRFFVEHVSLLASLITALYWPLIYFEGDLLAVTLVVFLDLIFILALVTAVQSGSRRMLFVSGVFLGLSALSRPSILVFAPFIPIAFRFSERKADKTVPVPGKWLRNTSIVFAGGLMIILPVIVRNYVVGRDFVPIASQGGVNFYIGNNPEANGSRAFLPGASKDLYGTFQGAIDLAEKDTGRAMKPSEVSNYYLLKGLDFISSRPAEAGKLLLKKFYFFWGGVERSNSKYIQFFWRNYGLGRFRLPGFWLLGPFALLGGVLLWSRRREFIIFYSFVLSYMAGVVLFFVNARFRLPVMPILAIFAAFAILYAYHALRSRGYYFGKALLLFLGFALFVNYDFISMQGVRAMDEIITRYELAEAFMKRGDKSSALAEFENARSIQEKYPSRGYADFSDDIEYSIGSLYFEQGLYSRAIESLQKVRRSKALTLQARILLAGCFAKKNMLDRAVDTYAQILKLDPDNVQSRLGIAEAYRIMGDSDKLEISEKILRGMSQQPHSYNTRVYLELAHTLAAKGDQQGALGFYQAAADDPSLQKEAFLGAAWMCKKLGKENDLSTYINLMRNRYPLDNSLMRELRVLDSAN